MNYFCLFGFESINKLQIKNTSTCWRCILVGGEGLEPSRSSDPQILSLVRLPITSSALVLRIRFELISDFFIPSSVSLLKTMTIWT